MSRFLQEKIKTILVRQKLAREFSKAYRKDPGLFSSRQQILTFVKKHGIHNHREAQGYARFLGSHMPAQQLQLQPLSRKHVPPPYRQKFPYASQEGLAALVDVLETEPDLVSRTGNVNMTELLKRHPSLRHELFPQHHPGRTLTVDFSQPPVARQVMGSLAPHQASKLILNQAWKGLHTQSKPGIQQLPTSMLAKKKDRTLFLQNIGKEFHKSLRVIRLHDMRLTPGQVGALVGSLPRLVRLEHLDLSDNRIGVEGAIALAGVLHRLVRLEHLDLGENRIGADGFIALAGALPHLARLKYLILHYNQMGTEGAIALAHALPRLAHLEHLDLSNNQIGTAGAIALAGALPHLPRLKYLYMHNNPIGEEGEQALAHALPRRAKLITR